MITLYIMNRGLYYLIVTVVSAMIAVPPLVNIILGKNLVPEVGSNWWIKLAFLFFIVLSETGFIRNTIAKVICYLCVTVLAAGILFRIMHWPYSFEMLTVAGVVLFVIFIIFALLERNKFFIHFLLFLFLLMRIAILTLVPPSIAYTMDIVFSLILLLAGLWILMDFKHFRKRKK